MSDFFSTVNQLVASHAMVVDRPKGTRHPRFTDAEYPIDYGYLDGTTGGDGSGIDVFRGSASLRGVAAVAATVNLHKRDGELKILLDCTEEEVDVVVSFLRDELRLATTLLRP